MRQVRLIVTAHEPLDVRGRGVIAAAPTVGVQGVSTCHISDIYFVRGDLSDADLTQLCDQVLADPAAHTVTWIDDTANTPNNANNTATIEVAFLPGVMDP